MSVALLHHLSNHEYTSERERTRADLMDRSKQMLVVVATAARPADDRMETQAAMSGLSKSLGGYTGESRRVMGSLTVRAKRTRLLVSPAGVHLFL